MEVANNAVSKLVSSISSGDTTFSVTPGTGSLFPAGDFPLTLIKSNGSFEIIKCTSRASDVFTVVRAQEGTSGLAFLAGDRVELRITKAAWDSIKFENAVHAATNVTALADDDEIGATNSADSFKAIKIKWSAFKLLLKAIAAGQVHAATEKTTPVNNDEFAIVDSAASYTLKKFKWSSLVTAITSALSTVYATFAQGEKADSAVQPSGLQSQTYTACTTGGTSTAYTLTPSPAITANAVGVRFRVTFALATGASPTLSVSGKAALPLVYRDGTTITAIASAQLPINWTSDVVCTGSQWLVLEVPASSAAHGCAVFTSSGTWVVPAGVTSGKVTVTGGGAGGGGTDGNKASSGGGSGATAIKTIALTPGESHTITVGRGGAGTLTYNGGSGGTSSFGSVVSATGGTSASAASATGGDINIPGGVATSDQDDYVGGNGSPSYWGSGGAGGRGAGGTGIAAPAYGAGGGGGASNSSTDVYGGAGKDGIVVIEW